MLFEDRPDAGHHPFALHSLCSAGAPAGVVAGQWLGPWVLCNALQRAVEAAHEERPAGGVKEGPAGYQEQVGAVPAQPQAAARDAAAAPPARELLAGFEVHVLRDPGGGAPGFNADSFADRWAGAASSGPAAVQPPQTLPSSEAVADSGGATAPRGAQVAPAPPPAASRPVAPPPSQHTLLLVVPLTLGVGSVDARYLEQLRRLLCFPQSVGIVGGRPGASLYFVGFQADYFIHLDPHECQPASSLPAAGADTYFCSGPRLVAASAIDPSLAIGLVVSSAGELEDLSARLAALEREFRSAPLVTVVGNAAVATSPSAAAASRGSPTGSGAAAPAAAPTDAEREAAGEWELL